MAPVVSGGVAVPVKAGAGKHQLVADAGHLQRAGQRQGVAGEAVAAVSGGGSRRGVLAAAAGERIGRHGRGAVANLAQHAGAELPVGVECVPEAGADRAAVKCLFSMKNSLASS